MEYLKGLSFEQKKNLYTYLCEFLTQHRIELFENNIKHRTRHLAVILENVFQSHNISAVLRSCDCFGVQDVHIIENLNPYHINPEIALGSSKWLNIHHHNQGMDTVIKVFDAIHQQGYQIIATTPHPHGYDIESLNIETKTALIFGTEKDGLSEEVIRRADGYMKIPMHGFTESLNISVSAGISLYALTTRLHKMKIPWQVSEQEAIEIKIGWAAQSIKHAEYIIQEFISEHL